ncbi:ATP-binding protein [Streptosporangium sp. NPDC051022]|uniref:ATP-binding protein n=1 Tax=Streptosporangium sp. NPDC051022 TaxID=3155752 RepID=UPI003448A8A1
MAGRFLSVLVGAFGDRLRTMAGDSVDLSRPYMGWSSPLDPASTHRPLFSRRFRATPDQVRPARNFVAGLLGDSHPLRDDAVLLTSELATNAIEHSAGPTSGSREFLITVSFVARGVLVTVQDSGSLKIPCPRESGPDATGGRGLALVNSLATQWGFHRDSMGTVIWFELGSPG